MAYSFPRILLSTLFLVNGAMQSTAFATPKKPEADQPFNLAEACGEMLNNTILGTSADGEARSEEALAVLAQRKPFSDLLTSDPNKNLVVQAPFMIMNAAQRVSVLGRSAGVESIRIPGLPNDIVVFNTVSEGVNGQRIIGQVSSIEAILDNVDAQAMGDRSAASVPLSIGSHGSGKSATIEVLRETFQAKTTELNTPYAIWSFEWINMDLIPDVVRLQPRVIENNGTLSAALDDSPILLLPKEIRDQVINLANDAVLDLTKGRQDAMPFLKLNPQDQSIRDTLLLHYRNVEKRDLTSNEIVTILNRHVRLKRVIWDDTSGALPVIDAQGDDPDVAGIFLTPNPVMRVTKGAANIFAWEPGKILKGHGNVVFLDEVLRNPKDLLRLFLRIFQERKVSNGGSPDFPLDTVFLAATNTSSLNELLADPNMHALVDRFLMVEMPWTTKPNEIAQVLLHNYSKHLKMQKLPGLENATEEIGPIEPAKMSEVYPRNASPANSGPDYRYKLLIPLGDREIKFSPHAIRLMSYIIAATRMNTDQAKAKEVMPFSKIVNSGIFRDPIARIRFEEGKLPDVTNGEIEDLRKLARLLDEGSEGIASRDAGRWLNRVVQEAQRSENRNTVTPDLVFKVFQEMLGKRIKTPDNKSRLKWQGLALTVATHLVVPYIEQDVTMAMAADQASIKTAYYDVIDELSAQYRDRQATTYKSRITTEEKPIDLERQAMVHQIFLRQTGRALDAAQIAMYHEQMRSPNGNSVQGDSLHPGLMSAIAAYYAKLTGRLVSVTDLAKHAQTGEGDTEIRSQFSAVLRNMARMGYDTQSAQAALRFIGRMDALTAQVRREQGQ